MGKNHHRHEDADVQRKEGQSEDIGNEAEEGRRETASHIGACHLDPDQGLGAVLPEQLWSTVNKAGIDGCTAQSHHREGGKRDPLDIYRQNHDYDSDGGNRLTHADHLAVRKLDGDKTVEESSNGNTYVEKTCKACCSCRIHSLGHYQITGGPGARGGLHGTVTQECEHYALCSGDAHHFLKGYGSPLLFCGLSGIGLGSEGLFPKRQADDQDACQNYLEDRYRAVTVGPGMASGKGISHDVWAQCSADAPEAVQPGHVAALVVKRHIVVQGRIHTAGSQSVRYCPDAQEPETPCYGEQEQRPCGHGHADCRDHSYPQCLGEPVTEKTGDNGASCDYHAHDSHVGDRNRELAVHHGPGGTEDPVGKTEADECQIDYRQKQ